MTYSSKYPRIFYTSDLHIDHKFVSGTRGFLKEEHKGKSIDFNNKDALPPDVREWTDPKTHNDWLARLWDSTVRDIDIVYILGDMSNRGEPSCLTWLDERPGKKNLIVGNHEPIHPSNHDSEKVMPLWMPHFNDIQTFNRRKLDGIDVLMSHFPYSGRGAEGHGVRERHTQYRLKDLGMPLLHGHTHGQERIHFSDEGTPQIHVGIDAWKRLLSQDEVIELLREIYPKPKPAPAPARKPAVTYQLVNPLGKRMVWNSVLNTYVEDRPRQSSPMLVIS